MEPTDSGPGLPRTAAQEMESHGVLLLEAALALAEAGLRVIPVCHPKPGLPDPGRRKRPSITTGTEHLDAATTDLAILRSWSDRGLLGNLGLVTHYAERLGGDLVVLDIDPEHGGTESLATLEADHEPLPPTWHVRTGSGGSHFYFLNRSKPVHNSAGALAPGVDVRGRGGYAIAPPSVHPATGRRYEWINGPADREEPAELPAWLLEQMLASKSRGDVRVPASSTVFATGARNDALTRIAGKLRYDGLESEEILASLLEINRRRCQPPLPETEIRGIAESARKWAIGSDVQIPKSLRDLACWTPSEWGTDAPPAREYLLNRPGEDSNGMLPLGRVGMLVGGGGIGKSWALTQLAVSVAAGHPWLGNFPVVTPGHVFLALGEEESTEARRRIFRSIESLEGEHQAKARELVERIMVAPLMGEQVALTSASNGTDFAVTTFASELEALLRELEVEWKLIVLDPVSRFAGPDTEKDNAAATRLCQAVERLTRVPGNPTVLLSHHTNKMSRTGGTDATASRGASALTDGVRWQGNLDAIPHPVHALGQWPDLVDFHVTKSNYGRSMDTRLYLHRGDHGVLGPATAEHLEALDTAKRAAGRVKESKPKADKATTKRNAPAGRRRPKAADPAELRAPAPAGPAHEHTNRYEDDA